MNSSVYRISLDIHKPESQILLDMKRMDAKRTILINLTEDGKAYQITPDCSAVFTAEKPDGNPIYNDCSIEGNVITYKVTQQTISCVGEVDCEIRLFNSDGGLITSPRFGILVSSTIYNGEEIIESAPEFDALQNRINKADALYDKVNTAYENGELNGEDGEKGEKGDKGEPGESGVPAVHLLPTDAKEGDLFLYAPQNTITLADSGKRIYFDWEEFRQPVSEEASTVMSLWCDSGEFEGYAERSTEQCMLWFNKTRADGVVEYLQVDFLNGILDSEASLLSVTNPDSVVKTTYFNSIDELPLYFDIPEFENVDSFEVNGNAYLFHTEYRLMKYQGGEWVEAVDVPTKTSQLENDCGFITNNKIELATETATLQPNTYYSFGEAAALTLEFAEGDAAKVNEYSFTFISGATPTVLTLPSSVQWANELTVEANKRYEISIVDNIGLWCAVDVEAVTE